MNAANQEDNSRLHRVQEMLDSGTMHKVSGLLNALQPGEIAHLLEGLPLAEREIMWGLVQEKDGEVLVHLADDVRDDLVSKMDAADIAAAAANLDPDDLADLIQELPATVTNEVLASLDAQSRHRLETVLSYPEDTAGGLMNVDTVTIRPEVTLDTALRYMRQLGDRVPSSTDALIVVNRDDSYLGMLPLARLVTGDRSDTVAEVMSVDFVPIPVSKPDTEVAARFERHDLVSAPVIDDDGRLLGRITIDDVVDVIREEGEHQFMGQAGLSEDEDMFAPVFTSARRRAVWLGVNLVTAILASWVIGQFQATLERLVALAVLMPIVANMGGIAGTQTMTLAIRGIALKQLSLKNLRWLLRKEFAVGFLNSLLWAATVGVIATLWFNDTSIGWLIAVAMTINLLFAAVSGALIPMILDKFNIDPALAGGVFLTTVTDIVGFLAFLGLATVFLI
ncbi:magnesium transporter [Solemya elarraichensis gill symbiont]|uniref:Magnesium transporter MgtE n=1 Tax=Solemya elarraichensis gill symbiont TaxID=1918949 RepID=A0A1T2LCX4_9GAMM|nr:magnesium transporter [Solemya elarraichensis gill symbiont]OOZ42939.1 magnesium transporter [Solemya elarraichensis gill symbiont]